MTKTGFIGLGEVGRIYAAAFARAGLTVAHMCDPVPGEAARRLASDLGAPLHGGPEGWLAECDLIVAAPPGGLAPAAFRDALPFLRKGATYADFSTAAPEEMRNAARLAAAAGIRFADVAILGAVSARKGATALALAGDGAAGVAEVAARLGAPCRICNGEAGQASRLKLLRSVFTKGLEALAVETLAAAESQGLSEEFHTVMSDLYEIPLRQFLDTLIRTHVIHAGRRLHEVEEAQAQLEAAGIRPAVTPGVAALFRRSVAAESPFAQADELPGTPAALAWLITTQGRG